MKQSDIVYAVVRVGAKQYRVAPGDEIVVDRLDVDEGKSVTFEPLAVRTKEAAFDPGAAKGVRVKGKVTEHFLGEKLRVFTYKPKSTFRKTRGHRSRLSRVAIDSITVKEKKEKDLGA